MLALTDVERAFGSGDAAVSALRRVTLSIPAGDYCAIMGPSGSGKSTLLNIIGLLDRPTSGQLSLIGEDVSAIDRDRAAILRNRHLGFVFQSFQLLPRLNAWQNVALPLIYRGTPKQDRRAAAIDWLGRVGLGDRADQPPATMSGGQRQRVAIARALVTGAGLLLADEPTGSLDSRTAQDIMALFTALNREAGITIAMVTHDRSVADLCDRRIDLADGRVVGDTGARAHG